MPHGLHVLVVDGEVTARNLIAGMIEGDGHAVRVANDGDATERAPESGEIDVVVSATDPPRPALLDRRRPTPPVIAVDGPIHGRKLLAALRDLAGDI